MLGGTICPVTAAISTVGVAGAAWAAARSKTKPNAARFGAIAALIFAGQMVNFPVQNGTSGHLLGAVLASALMGTPFGILAMAFVLLIQTLIFADGGLSALGANVLNMAIIGAGIGGILFKQMTKASSKQPVVQSLSLGLTAWFSVVMASLACSIELALSGTVPFSRVAGSMVNIHALIGMGEAVLTVALYHAFVTEPLKTSSKWGIGAPLVSALLIGFMLSPFASSFPDGLEWVAARYQFLHESAPSFVSPLADYAVPFVQHEFFSTALAGLMGVLVTFFGAWLLIRVLRWKGTTSLAQKI
jgi:cobalt/nickel transport system permease protein